MERSKKLLLLISAVVIIAASAPLLGKNFLINEDNTERQPTAGESSSKSQVILTGSGSSFVAPQMYAWASQIKSKYPWLVVEYESVGSGAGLSNFLQRVKDFGASDPPMPYEAWVKNRNQVLQMPIIIGAVVVVYNVPGVDKQLKLSGEVLAGIYRGEIEYWDDPAIKALNPDAQLPHREIVAVHRSDSSGTTHVFTLYLFKSAPGVWDEELVGKAIEWPVDATGRGVGSKGNEGVTQTVKNTPYSIGYVEWSYALDANLPMAAIENALKEYVTPSVESIQKAASSATLPDSPLGDFSEAFGSIVYPNASGSYPITSFVFLFFWTSYPESKVEGLKKFIEYINTEGQKTQNIVRGYVPIPESIRELNLQALNYISAAR